MAISNISAQQSVGFAWRHYYEMTKPKVVMLIAFSALVGMLLSHEGLVAWEPLLFGLLLGGLSMLLLYLLVNPLTALLSFFALIGYAVIHTLFLKRSTPQNIVWGGLAGAAPPLLGWCAVTGEVTLEAFLLLLIIFVWTPPHF
jgi:protoheme IX farnesyltransferase